MSEADLQNSEALKKSIMELDALYENDTKQRALFRGIPLLSGAKNQVMQQILTWYSLLKWSIVV